MMPAIKTDMQEKYNAEFNPQAYIQDYKSTATCNFATHIHHAYKKIVDVIGEKSGETLTLLDVGTGASIWALITPAEMGFKITASDFCETQRDYLKNWIGGEADAFNWTDIIKKTLQIEAVDTGEAAVQNRSKKVKDSIKEVLSADVLIENLLHPVVREKYDVISCTWNLECAVESDDEYRRAFSNVIHLLRPGGFLVMTGVCGQTYYEVGGVRFPVHPISKALVDECVDANRLDIEVKIENVGSKTLDGLVDNSDHFFLFARLRN